MPFWFSAERARAIPVCVQVSTPKERSTTMGACEWIAVVLAVLVYGTSAAVNDTDATPVPSAAPLPVGTVLVYHQGRKSGTWTVPPWGANPFKQLTTEILWTACAFNGIAFFDTSKKYRLNLVQSVVVTLQTDEPVTLGLRIHNAGVPRDVFTTDFDLPGSSTVMVTVPVAGFANSTTLFDQIIFAEVVGKSCQTPDAVHILDVRIAGDPAFSTDYVRSINGAIIPPTPAPGPGSNPGGSPAKSDASRTAISWAVTAVLVVIPFLM